MIGMIFALMFVLFPGDQDRYYYPPDPPDVTAVKVEAPVPTFTVENP